MNKKLLREKLIELTGYWIYKKKVLPVGADIVVDLQEKIGIDAKTIFDVGANIGQTALVFSSHFPKATIHSFEPVSATFQKLLSNTQGNPRIKCHQLALSNVKEQISISVFEDDQSSVLNSLKNNLQSNTPNTKLETINTDTLDHFAEENNIDSIDLLKIDTEGYEIPVLNGAVKSLQNHKVKMIYLEVGFSKQNTRNSYLTDVLELLAQYDFSFFGLYEIHHYNLKSEHHFGNALFVHKNYSKNNNSY
jgi:FkbM family methyltransferase